MNRTLAAFAEDTSCCNPNSRSPCIELGMRHDALGNREPMQVAATAIETFHSNSSLPEAGNASLSCLSRSLNAQLHARTQKLKTSVLTQNIVSRTPTQASEPEYSMLELIPDDG